MDTNTFKQTIYAYALSQLNAPFVAQSWMYSHNINYWKPQTLDEALFNWWD